MTGPLVVGIGGSASPASATNQLLRRCLAHAERLGARTVALTDLGALPIFSADRVDPAAAQFVEAVRSSDGVIISTPGYHGGMSGLVKNALDHLEALRTDARPYLDGRAVGVIVGAAGWQACGTALVSVRSAIHALRGWPTPFGVTVNTAEQRVGDDDMDPAVDGALELLARQVTDFARWRAAADSSTASRRAD